MLPVRSLPRPPNPGRSPLQTAHPPPRGLPPLSDRDLPPPDLHLLRKTTEAPARWTRRYSRSKPMSRMFRHLPDSSCRWLFA
ncbi:hypothetical protein DLJ54_08845 [Corynebacterium heidelbergense]|uniref:Uncharacterized protein n=1 Tax=Corynebacterium heidelbergense TaxID=2055947 RepID=A0A364V3Y3_9CORY|nr:hypothetical protein DLJ54_08845 [Corynebacterium heidelbergense]